MNENNKVIDHSRVQNQFYDFEKATAGAAVYSVEGNKCKMTTLHQHFIGVLKFQFLVVTGV